ncbi:hypothetical protein SIN8267_01425 [Sinobacterium norvegicum]|uniref:Uncharacterized protein n=1 Tax=Sinobacterium norvegicum TaxID=1641715 RepID=A0ABN8EG49_9GAMM|nr:hypothetical protein [Sinobacterium norvegicum]CAH0991322.1 hypothetical protein SIN8267_01425 [Sinobacterium norvegicum]
MTEQYQIIDSRTGLTEQQQQQVLAMWQQGRALPSTVDAQQRLKQVAQLAYDGQGELAGIYTSYPQVNSQLGKSFYHIRSFVRPEHRLSYLSLKMFHKLLASLEQDFVTGKDQSCIGMIAEVENPGLKSHLNQAVWKPAPFVYIGDNAQQQKVYVYYFPGAVID